MKYLIKGSMVKPEKGNSEVERLFEDFGDADAYRQKFKEACREIGERLADKHELLIGSYRDSTVGPHVSDGANAFGEREDRRITIKSYQPTGENESEPQGLDNVRFDPVRNDGPWSVALLPALDAADVVIALGGGENTRALGVSAVALRKPIVAVPSFGGASREIYEQTIDEYRNYYGLSVEETSALTHGWSDETLPAILSVADKLVKRRRSARMQFALLAVIPVLLIIWTILFTGVGEGLGEGVVEGIENIHFFARLLLMLAVSALIGTALRITTRLYTGRILEVTRQDVLIDTAAGLLLAFVFFLLYLLGALAYPGRLLDVATGDGASAKIPPDTALLITLVGVAGAFLLDEGFERLTGYLRPFLSGRNANS